MPSAVGCRPTGSGHGGQSQIHLAAPDRASGESGLESSCGDLGTWSGLCQILSSMEDAVLMLLCMMLRVTVVGPDVLLAPEGRWLCVLWEEELSVRKEIIDGVVLGSDLMLLCPGRSARQEAEQPSADIRLGGPASRVRAGIMCEGRMHEHEDQRGRNGNLSNSKGTVCVSGLIREMSLSSSAVNDRGGVSLGFISHNVTMSHRDVLAVKIKRVTTESIKQGTSNREQGLLILSQKSLEKSHPCCLLPAPLSQERHGQPGAESKVMAGGSHSPVREYAQE